MITKHYSGSSLQELRSRITRECGPEVSILRFRYVKPRGIRRLFFGPRIDVTVQIPEPARAQRKKIAR